MARMKQTGKETTDGKGKLLHIWVAYILGCVVCKAV